MNKFITSMWLAGFLVFIVYIHASVTMKKIKLEALISMKTGQPTGLWL